MNGSMHYCFAYGETSLIVNNLIAGDFAFLLAISSPAALAITASAGIAAGLLWVGRRKLLAQSQLLESELRKANLEIEDWRSRLFDLQQEADQAKSALSRMRDGVILLAASGNVLLINPSARRLLQIDPVVELRDRRITDLIRIPELSDAIKSAASGEGVRTALLEVPADGGIRPLRLVVTPFGNLLGTRLLVSLRDETEARHIEEMRREFVANTSHELKTPLAAIKGYAETVELAIQDDPDAAKHFMRQINSECFRLERLIEDMMQLARAQSHGSVLSKSDFHLQDVVENALASYAPVAQAKSIQLIDENTYQASVHADREATLTIVNNLIGNAVRYTSRGGTVRVGCRDAGKYSSVYVHDTGIGISPGDQKRVFERFYRVDKKRQEGRSDSNDPFSSDGGTGIGLAIVKALTEALNGEVRLKSQPGQGSKFEVLLPKPDQQLTNSTSASAQVSPDGLQNLDSTS